MKFRTPQLIKYAFLNNIIFAIIMNNAHFTGKSYSHFLCSQRKLQRCLVTLLHFLFCCDYYFVFYELFLLSLFNIRLLSIRNKRLSSFTLTCLNTFCIGDHCFISPFFLDQLILIMFKKKHSVVLSKKDILFYLLY